MKAQGMRLLPWWGVIGLALLGVPRVVAHDLELVGPAVNAVLVFLPPVVWVAVVAALRPARPVASLLLVGAAYGVLLGAVHQLLWSTVFAAGAPSLGGALAGTLSAGAEELVLRSAALISSIATGLLVGAVCAAVAWLLVRALPARAPTGS
ncbi:hypothetical protein [Nocardiopsis coralliicola]